MKLDLNTANTAFDSKADKNTHELRDKLDIISIRINELTKQMFKQFTINKSNNNSLESNYKELFDISMLSARSTKGRKQSTSKPY